MDNGLGRYPKTVVEFGPGASIGTGLAALIAGAEHYHSLDVLDYTNTELNIEVFDELVALFVSRADVPDIIEFPSHILKEDYMNLVLTKERLNSIRDSLRAEDGKYISSHIPCNDRAIIAEASVDFIFSHAVMEHVEDINSYYENMHYWLKQDGITSHQIDFECHGLAEKWNGHWAYSAFIWKVIKGKKNDLINRFPCSSHIACLQKVNFDIVQEIKYTGEQGIKRRQLASRFKRMSDDDLNTKGAIILAEKNPGVL